MAEPDPYYEDSSYPRNEEFEKALADRSVEIRHLLQAARWRRGATADTARYRAVGEYYLDPLVAAFRAAHPGGRISVYGLPAAVVKDADGEISIRMAESALAFDWSDARRLLFGLNFLADEVRTWLKLEEQSSHLERIYDLATHVMAAVDSETKRAVQNGGTEASPIEPSDHFRLELQEFVPEIQRATELFVIAAQRTAQTRYATGMAYGAGVLGVLAAALAIAFALLNVQAFNGAALLGGGLGAIISVLHRMTRSELQLDYQAAGRMLTTLGALRPVIGATFGMVAFALIVGDIVPAVVAPDGAGPAAAFFAGVGFLAGFNERFAQDMLAGAGKRLGVNTSAEVEAWPVGFPAS